MTQGAEKGGCHVNDVLEVASFVVVVVIAQGVGFSELVTGVEGIGVSFGVIGSVHGP